MSASNPLVIVFLTYARTAYALQTIAAMRANFKYDNTLWYVADDGSDPAHVDAVLTALGGERVIGYHSERIGYGASANRAWYEAHTVADVSLFLEDDWALLYEYDPTPHVKMLAENDNVGMIRLGYLQADLQATTVPYSGAMYMRLGWENEWTFCGHPALRHRRAREAWGAYPEGLYPGETELAYAAQIRHRRGPCIVRPIDGIPSSYGLFAHIGGERSYKMPGEA